MEFKRFGGGYHRTGDGGSNINVTILGAAAFIIFGVLGIIFNSFLILIGFSLLMLSFFVSAFVSGGATFGMRTKRFDKRINEARAFYADGQLLRALAMINLAKAHGSLPDDLKMIEEEIESNIKT